MGQLFGEMGQHYLVTDVCRERMGQCYLVKWTESEMTDVCTNAETEWGNVIWSNRAVLSGDRCRQRVNGAMLFGETGATFIGDRCRQQ